MRTIPRKKRNNTEDRRAFTVAAAQLCGADDMLTPNFISNQDELSINPHKPPFGLLSFVVAITNDGAKQCKVSVEES
jgi:hypothetical protein